jgi:transposase InsO family protein
VNQLCALHERMGCPYRALCTSAAVAYPTFMRWKSRADRGEPLLHPPGPKPVGSLDLAGLQAQLRTLGHGPHRSAGTTALYAAHRQTISRRGFQKLVKQTRREVLQKQQASLRRVRWEIPGAVWSVDPTVLKCAGEPPKPHREPRSPKTSLQDGAGGSISSALDKGDGRPTQKLTILPVLDLASRYKLPPLIGERLSGAMVATQLEEWFRRFGAPLVLKRDNGSNLNSEAVNEVLARWLVIPLNSPPHYPPYNGGIERSQRELKEALRPKLVYDSIPGNLENVALLTVHELNHRPRRCLQGRNSCEAFAGAKTNLGGYTRRRRKEMFEQIRELAMNIMLEQPARTQAHADAAWRRAVETWLLKQGIITISEPKSGTQFP